MEMMMNRSWVAGVMMLAAAWTAQAQDAMPDVRFELVGKVEERPVLVTHDGRGRAFIVEQPGRIWQIVNGKIADKPYVDLTEKVYSPGECGLLGLAFHPRFADNGRFYIYYIAEKAGEGRRKVRINGKEIDQATIK